MATPNSVRARLAGCIAPIVTPLDSEGVICLPALETMLEFHAAQGVTGIVPGDLVGEYPALSHIERETLIDAVVRFGQGRFAVVALVSHASIDTAVKLARFSERAGVDAIKLALPYPYVPAEEMILEYVRRVTAAVELPFILESSDAQEVPLSVVAELCKESRFVGLEEMGSDLGRLDRLYRDFSDRLALLPAGDAALFVLCLLGAPGCIATENNFAPTFMRELLGACRRRDLDRALAMFSRRAQFRDLFRDGLARDAFTPWTKAAMELLGLPVGKPRMPHAPLTADETARLRTALQQQFGLAVPN